MADASTHTPITEYNNLQSFHTNHSFDSTIKELMCPDTIIENYPAPENEIIEKIIVGPIQQIEAKIEEEVSVKPKSTKKSKKIEKKKKNDEIVVKHTKIKSWSDKINSIEFNQIFNETLPNARIKLRPATQKNSNIYNTISIDSDVFFVMDFHSHICLKDVGGYIFGIFNSSTNSIHIVEAFPLIEGFSDDPIIRQENNDNVKAIINSRRKIEPAYSLFGRYFSNLDIQPDPTIQDIVSHESLVSEMSDILFDNHFYTIIISPYYDQKMTATIESSFSVFRINNSIKTESGIPLPTKCEFKKFDVEITDIVLKKIQFLSFVTKKTGAMLNMSMNYWCDINLRMKMIASCLQHAKTSSNLDDIMILLNSLTSV
ncbi:hypothetical protein HZS_5287 [Henneguya salminicola]|nr:hypothetical protein HZS_5287 [Henneguya salminicola]